MLPRSMRQTICSSHGAQVHDRRSAMTHLFPTKDALVGKTDSKAVYHFSIGALACFPQEPYSR